MVNWKEHRLAELAEIVMGQSPKGDTCNDDGEGVPLLFNIPLIRQISVGFYKYFVFVA